MPNPMEFIAALLSEESGLATARDMGITPEKLSSVPMARSIYEAILKYSSEPRHLGLLPSSGWLKQRFPDMELPDVSHRLVEISEALDNDLLTNQVNRLISRLQGVTDEKGIREALSYLVSGGIQLMKDGTRQDDAIVELMADTVIAEYNEIKNRKGLLGIPWPWDVLNKHTNGMCEGEYYLHYGLTKSMKTWVALYELAHVYKTSKCRIILYIREMPKRQVFARLTTLIAGVSYSRFKSGTMLPEEEDRLSDCAKKLREDCSESSGRIILMGGTDHVGIGAVQAKVRKWGAKVVFCDSAYLMADDRSKTRNTSHTNVGNISGDLRQMAIEENCVVLTTSQEHERTRRMLGSHGTASVGYCHKLIEDAELAFHIFKFHDAQTGEDELGFEFPATREYKDIPAFTIHAIPSENFGFKRMGVRNSDEEGKKQPAVVERIRWGAGGANDPFSKLCGISAVPGMS
jgi:replicative DNA helicase